MGLFGKSKVFKDGKYSMKYDYDSQYFHKKAAANRAKELRKKGYYARFVQESTSPNIYVVYRRKK